MLADQVFATHVRVDLVALVDDLLEVRVALAEENAPPIRALAYVLREVAEEVARLASKDRAPIEQLLHRLAHPYSRPLRSLLGGPGVVLVLAGRCSYINHRPLPGQLLYCQPGPP